MKILITGAGGQLGQDCRQRLESTHEVLALTSSRLDITDPEQVRQAIQAFRPRVVLNCAAYTAVDRCEEEQAVCRAVNATGPLLLARACRDSKARLIHISTDYVFAGDRPVPEPYREDDPTGPLSAYGRSKLAGEEAVRRELEDHLIIRTAWLFGINGRNFLKTMLRLCLAAPERTLRVVADQSGSLTWTASLADQIETLLTEDLRGTIHATAHGHCTWFAGALHFLQTMDVPFRLEPCTTADYPTPAHRPANSILENSRLRRAGLDRMRTWQEDVENFARKHRRRLLEEARPR